MTTRNSRPPKPQIRHALPPLNRGDKALCGQKVNRVGPASFRYDWTLAQHDFMVNVGLTADRYRAYVLRVRDNPCEECYRLLGGTPNNEPHAPSCICDRCTYGREAVLQAEDY